MFTSFFSSSTNTFLAELCDPLRHGRQLTACVWLARLCVSHPLLCLGRTHTDLFEDEEEEEEDEDLGFAGSLGWMAILTIFISILSEWLLH